jgi:hypothetical protein
MGPKTRDFLSIILYLFYSFRICWPRKRPSEVLMTPQWEILLGEPKFAAPALASLQAASPHNAHSPDAIGVFVSVWCGRDYVKLDGGSIGWLAYGFRIGEIQIEVKNGVISHEGRLKQEFFREKIGQKAKDATKSGALGFDLSKAFGTGEIANKSGEKISSGSVFLEEKHGEYFRIIWRVADAGHNTWRLFGEGLNPDGILENKIMGEEPLFFVEPRSDADQIQINIKYFGDLFGLWVDEVPFRGGSNSVDVARSKEAVAAAILAKSLRKVNEHDSGRLVLLCQQRLTLRRVQETT